MIEVKIQGNEKSGVYRTTDIYLATISEIESNYGSSASFFENFDKNTESRKYGHVEINGEKITNEIYIDIINYN